MNGLNLPLNENILKRVLLQAGAFNVDSRYMLWNMAEVDGAVNLLEEMSLAPQVSARATSPLKPAAAVSAEPARR